MAGFKILFFLPAVMVSATAFGSQVAVDVKLSPAGSFKAETAKITGSATKTADGVVAENIVVDATTFKTGISLRDEHFKKRLQTDKFPQIKLVKAVGKEGKGKARIEIMGMTKDYAGTYTVDGNTIKAQFPVKLPDLKITDVKYMGVGVKDEVVIHVDIPIAGK
jgi:hypothetical protein